MAQTSSSTPTLDATLHTRYWTRCLKSLLPTAYQTSDSSRLLLAFFILAALDVLSPPGTTLASSLPAQQITNLRLWVLSLQHPNGGFCGSPNHKFPKKYYAQGQRDVDPANIAPTFFALLSLGYVGGLEHVDRVKTLRWLKTLQRADGSFGEVRDHHGNIGGGKDMRYCHFASGIRRLLRGDVVPRDGEQKFEDFDVEGLVRYIRAGETYDGGFAESSEHEAHAGYTYCATASLYFLDRLNPPNPQAKTNQTTPLTGLRNVPATIRWLMSRQLAYEEEGDSEDDGPVDTNEDAEPPSLESLSLIDSVQVGCSGRCNKKADTCYCFFVGATLSMLGKEELVNAEGFRRFLLEQTQHQIGGFGKCPGYPPDLYHAYLGLGILSIMGEPGLKPVHPAFCVTIDAKENLENTMEKILAQRKVYHINGIPWITSELDENHEKRMALDEGLPEEYKGYRQNLKAYAASKKISSNLS